MDKIYSGMILYHGSYCEVREPYIDKCARYKDFGQGFYLTTSEKQAEAFAKISTGIAVSKGIIEDDRTYGVINKFRVTPSENIREYIFNQADADWLHCIVAHRSDAKFKNIVDSMKDFDIIAGKIANDNTNASIAAYMSETFGPVGSESADKICISLLLPERLCNQYCFRTERSLKCLSFMGSEKVWMK